MWVGALGVDMCLVAQVHSNEHTGLCHTTALVNLTKNKLADNLSDRMLTMCCMCCIFSPLCALVTARAHYPDANKLEGIKVNTNQELALAVSA